VAPVSDEVSADQPERPHPMEPPAAWVPRRRVLDGLDQADPGLRDELDAALDNTIVERA